MIPVSVKETPIDSGKKFFPGMMNHPKSQFGELYFLALLDYLNGGGESALGRGYELGRQAVVNGLGILDAVGVYQQALEESFLFQLEPRERERILRALEFLSETLSPFEVTHRAFRETTVKLRLLSEHLQTVREEEQARISRDIHDELGRALTCLKLDLSMIHNQLLGKRNENPRFKKKSPGKPIKEKLFVLDRTKSMLKLIDQTIQCVRKIASELRPPVLDDLGLDAAIEWQLREFQMRTEIQCKLELPSPGVVIDQRRSTSVFRIFQEVLTNIARHAQATRVRICLKKQKTRLVLDVEDNGKGISPSEITAVQSLGLLGIRERAAFLGGDVRISGHPGKGTRVTVRIPLAREGL
ncbi:MAG: ATP-binding protein [Nitrospiria bacterium]